MNRREKNLHSNGKKGIIAANPYLYRVYYPQYPDSHFVLMRGTNIASSCLLQLPSII